MCNFNKQDEDTKGFLHLFMKKAAEDIGGVNFLLNLIEAIRAIKPNPLMHKDRKIKADYASIEWQKTVFKDKFDILNQIIISHKSYEGTDFNILDIENQKHKKKVLNMVKTIAPIEFIVKPKNSSDGGGFSFKVLSVGLPLDGYEVKIVDDELIEVPHGEVGEIIVSGDCVMKGYYNNPEATDNTIINGWLKTGDLGYIDDEGFIYIVDRKKDLIIAKGVNVYPREIEELIYKLGYIDSTAVIGVSDKETKDEMIVAFIELKEDVDKHITDEKKVKSFLKEHLANFKIPKHIYFIDDMQKNATNKVLKRKLKEDIENYIV
jgi:acyl-CoA synthetase (AMP-forming)/AMP-acid ligase II